MTHGDEPENNLFVAMTHGDEQEKNLFVAMRKLV